MSTPEELERLEKLTTEAEGGDTEAQFRWRNVYFGALALEVWAAPRIPIRFGATVSRSASREETLTPFSPPPGVLFGVYGGFGVRFGPIDLDLSFGWGGGPAYIVKENHPLCSDADVRTEGRGAARTLTASAGCAGSYDVDSYFLTLSASFYLGREDVSSSPTPEPTRIW